MICHPDYVPISELLMRFDRESAIRRIWLAQQAYAQTIGPEEFHLEFSLGRMTPGENVEFCIFNSLADHSYLSGPGDQVSFFSQTYFRSMLHEARLTWPMVHLIEKAEGMGPASALPEEFLQRHWIAPLPDAIARQAQENGKTIAEEAFASGAIYLYTRPALFFDRHTYSISLDALPVIFDAIGHENEWQVRRAVDILRPMEGWVWCTDREYVDSGVWLKAIEANIDASCTDLTRFQAAAGTSRTGRPATVGNDTLAAYRQIYPAGHGRLTWPKVLAEVNRRTGHGCSLDTLKRAVKESKSPNKIEAEQQA